MPRRFEKFSQALRQSCFFFSLSKGKFAYPTKPRFNSKLVEHEINSQ